MIDLSILSREDEAARERLNARAADMVTQAKAWSAINTGSWNLKGLQRLAPMLADAFSALDADVRLEPGDPFESVNASGQTETTETGPVMRVTARPSAPVQVVMSGHYDLADMKGGLCVMREALLAFESGPLKEKLGYQIVITPDEEIGNFASARALTEAARSGAHIGMTYEPCMDTGAMAGGRKGSAVFDIVLHGKAAHAGRAKQEGRSAIEAAAELVLGLEALNGERDGVTINVGSIDGGSPVNIVPDLAIVRFGARAPDAEAAQWTTEAVKRLFDRATARDGIHGHMHGGFYRPPKPRNAAQQALFDAVQATGRAIGLNLEFEDTGGVCEGNNIFAAGVPNVDTLGVMGGRIHSNEEYVIVNSFPERAALSALLLNRLADGRVNAAHIKALMEA